MRNGGDGEVGGGGKEEKNRWVRLKEGAMCRADG